jgi:hypothetical protein
MAVPYLIRAFAELFPGAATGTIKAQRPSPAAPARSFTPDAPRPVGLGASNETIVNIEAIPHLFVDEGDCVVQFCPAFEEAPRDTRFGTKILPDLAPHWSVVHQHTVPLREAIAVAIRAKGAGHKRHVAHEPRTEVPLAAQEHEPFEPRVARPAPERTGHSRAPRKDVRGDQTATTGRIVSWGEEDFPNRKPHGKPFYTSFAMHVDTVLGEQVLQGEGLKDAIAESRCKVGDRVTVRRLQKIKVAAFRENGQPILRDGQQVYWDKWLWSIT